MPKLKIKASSLPAIKIHHSAVASERLVYVAVANKKFHYPHGKSRIGYIGTTEVGADRMAQSAAEKQRAFEETWVKSLEFFPVTCGPRQKVKNLEKVRALAFTTVSRDFRRCACQQPPRKEERTVK